MDEKQLAELVAWMHEEREELYRATDGYDAYNMARYEAFSDVIVKIQMLTGNRESTTNFVNRMIAESEETE